MKVIMQKSINLTMFVWINVVIQKFKRPDIKTKIIVDNDSLLISTI